MNEDANETTLARQPLNDRRPNTAPIANGSRQKGAMSAYANDENLPINEDEDEEDEEVNDVSVYQNEPIEEDYDVHEIRDDGYGDDAGEATPDDTTNVQNDDHSEEEPSPVQAASLRTKKRKAPATTDDVDTPAEDSQNPPKKKRAGRPPKAQAQKATQEKTTEQRPAKKAKPSKPQPAKEREPLDPELEQVVENHVKRTGPLKGRSLYILKREVPTEQQAAHTRSGRVSVRPLAYWRNERCVYGDGEADLGQRYPLTTIKEIIRTEDIEPEKKAGKKRKGKKSKSKKHEEESDDDDDERDKWETADGVLHGYIKKWDTDKQVASNEEEITGTSSLYLQKWCILTFIEIAFAPTGIETRDVKDSTFRVAKLLSQPFFGSGIVELPAKGVKKPKNSKRMHMVFYVCYGRVQVDINGVQFTAGRGCIFQVPRGIPSPSNIKALLSMILIDAGNHYSFANITPKEARLFFTQAFMPNGSDNDNDNEPASSSKPAAAEPEPEPEVDATEAEGSKAPATKGKGRGRGRKAAAK
ncbi:hypothetical protein EIK77_008075 [Talaromyces pinophilus]|nr:hypothetical protein EIK77_008075 [Talaromyces pinophilus]